MPSSHQSLLKFARKHRYASARESHGVCFHAALLIGAHAQELGLEDRVRFLHWRVRDDANFREHWALSFRQSHVLDLTASQVDGNANPLRKMDSYPPNFGAPRDYPLALILHHGASALQAPAGARISAALIWRVQRSMVAYDLRRGPMPWAIYPLFIAAAKLAETLLVLSLQGVSDWATGRSVTLKSRLSGPAVSPHAESSNSLVVPQSLLSRALLRRAALGAPRRVARAVCAIFFLGVPV